MRPTRVLTGLLAVGLILSATPSAYGVPDRVPAGSDLPKDIHGTITIRVLGDSPSGHSDQTFQLTFQGGVESPGRLLAPVDVATLAFQATYFVYNPETDRDDGCMQDTFLGFRADEEGESARGWVDVAVPHINKGRRRAAAYLSVVPGAPYGEVGTGECGAALDYSRSAPLVGAVEYDEADSLVGRGIDHQTQQDTVSPRWVKLRFRKGVWRSRGSRTSTESDYGTRSVTVSWDIRSRRPSSACAVPPRRSVRGKSVAHARRMLKKYGFPRTRTVRVQSSVPRGRVDGIQTWFEPTLRCGKRVTINVAR